MDWCDCELFCFSSSASGITASGPWFEFSVRGSELTVVLMWFRVHGSQISCMSCFVHAYIMLLCD